MGPGVAQPGVAQPGVAHPEAVAFGRGVSGFPLLVRLDGTFPQTPKDAAEWCVKTTTKARQARAAQGKAAGARMRKPEEQSVLGQQRRSGLAEGLGRQHSPPLATPFTFQTGMMKATVIGEAASAVL